MKISQAGLLLLAITTLAGCVTNNKEVLDSKSPHYGKAALQYNSEEVQIIALDEKPWPLPFLTRTLLDNEIYIEPGKHKLESSLFWRLGNISTTMSPIKKTTCFTADPGKSYYIGSDMLGRLPSGAMDWKLKIHELTPSRSEVKFINQACD